MPNVEFYGYDNAGYGEPSQVGDWLKVKAEELGVDIAVFYSRGTYVTRETIGRLDVSFTELDLENTFVIFDYGSNMVDPGRRNYDYFYYDNRETRQVNSISLTYSRGFILGYSEDDADPIFSNSQEEHPYQIGVVSHMTMWIGLYSINLERQLGTTPSTEQLLSWLFDDAMVKAVDKEYFADLAASRETVLLEKFMEHAQFVTDKKVKQYLTNVDVIEKQMANVEQQATQLQIKLVEAMEAYTHQATLKETKDSDVAAQLVQLRRNAKCAKVGFDQTQNLLQIFTPELYIYSPNKDERARLGQFRIDFSMDTRTILLHNLTNAKKGRQHPHVPHPEAPCWGALSVVIRNLVTELEFPTLLDTIISYLEGYNPTDSYGVWVAWWFSEENGVEKANADGTFGPKENDNDNTTAELMNLLGTEV